MTIYFIKLKKYWEKNTWGFVPYPSLDICKDIDGYALYLVLFVWAIEIKIKTK